MSKILIIEDDRDLQSVLCDLLELAGFQTICADNGQMGLAIAQQCQPDLILSEIRMTEMDGYAILRALRQGGPTTKIPIIFLTAEPIMMGQFYHSQLAADDCLQKPFSFAQLLDAIRQKLATRIVGEIQSVLINESALTTSAQKRLNPFPRRIYWRFSRLKVINRIKPKVQRSSEVMTQRS